MNLLDSETIARAEALGLNARYVVEGYMAGEHRSPYHGFAVEFAQHREYTPGDDTRHLDWKVLAKTERHYIKQYEQETNYVAHLLVDGSESMKYGSGDVTKLDYAKQIAACLAYLILTRRDSVSLAIFDEEIQEYTPRSDNRKNLFKIVSKLAAFDANKETRTADVLHHVAHQLKRRGIIVLISDFFDDDDEVLEGVAGDLEAIPGALFLLQRRQELFFREVDGVHGSTFPCCPGFRTNQNPRAWSSRAMPSVSSTFASICSAFIAATSYMARGLA